MPVIEHKDRRLFIIVAPNEEEGYESEEFLINVPVTVQEVSGDGEKTCYEVLIDYADIDQLIDELRSLRRRNNWLSQEPKPIDEVVASIEKSLELLKAIRQA